MTTPYRCLAILALALALSACAVKLEFRSIATPIAGAPTLPPLANDAKVTVFQSEAECKVPFTPIATIHYTNPGKMQRLTSADAILPLQTLARGVGANAVIIDHEEATASGVVSRGIDAEARAVKIHD